jgi:hypothetical protein
VLGERSDCLSHATWPLLPLLPTVNGSQLPRPRIFIIGFDEDRSDIQCTKSKLCCTFHIIYPGTWNVQTVPGTR